MFPHRVARITLPLAALALLLVNPTAPARADNPCPWNSCFLASHPPCSDTGSQDATWQCEYPPYDGYLLDWHYGRFRIWTTSGAWPVGDDWGTARDDFKIIGLPPGTPLMFSVRLLVRHQAFAYDGGSFSQSTTSLTVGDQSSSVYLETPPGASMPLEEVVTVQVSKAAGELFRIQVDQHVISTLGGLADVWCALEFADLPPDAVVASCQGWGDPPVAARPTTWGRLKAIYR